MKPKAPSLNVDHRSFLQHNLWLNDILQLGGKVTVKSALSGWYCPEGKCSGLAGWIFIALSIILNNRMERFWGTGKTINRYVRCIRWPRRLLLESILYLNRVDRRSLAKPTLTKKAFKREGGEKMQNSIVIVSYVPPVADYLCSTHSFIKTPDCAGSMVAKQLLTNRRPEARVYFYCKHRQAQFISML